MHVYENRSSNFITVTFKNEFGNIIQSVIQPFSKIEFSYPALDTYVPIKLIKICDSTGKFLLPINRPETKVEAKKLESCSITIAQKQEEIAVGRKEDTIENTETLKIEEYKEVSKEEYEHEHEDLPPKTKRKRKL